MTHYGQLFARPYCKACTGTVYLSCLLVLSHITYPSSRLRWLKVAKSGFFLRLISRVQGLHLVKRICTRLTVHRGLHLNNNLMWGPCPLERSQSQSHSWYQIPSEYQQWIASSRSNQSYPSSVYHSLMWEQWLQRLRHDPT